MSSPARRVARFLSVYQIFFCLSVSISGGDKGLATVWTLNLIHSLESVSFLEWEYIPSDDERGHCDGWGNLEQVLWPRPTYLRS